MSWVAAFCGHKEQMARLGRHEWSVPRLITLAKDLPVMEVPLSCINN